MCSMCSICSKANSHAPCAWRWSIWSTWSTWSQVGEETSKCIVSEMLRGLDPLLRNELGDEVLAALGESLNHFWDIHHGCWVISEMCVDSSDWSHHSCFICKNQRPVCSSQMSARSAENNATSPWNRLYICWSVNEIVQLVLKSLLSFNWYKPETCSCLIVSLRNVISHLWWTLCPIRLVQRRGRGALPVELVSGQLLAARLYPAAIPCATNWAHLLVSMSFN